MIIFYYILTLRFSYDLEFIFHLSAIQIPDSSGGICLLPLLLLSLQKMRIKYGIRVDKYGEARFGVNPGETRQRTGD